MTADRVSDQPKLGLALAGGGFRASLFHLGVLRRLAELDLLRRVELLSTVSGGTIIGVLYVLLLKKYLEEKENLTCDDYLRLVDELDQILTRGVRRNLRTLLLLNPFGVLISLITGDTLSGRMGRIYERYLLEPVVRELMRERPLWKRILFPGRLPLQDLVIKPGGKPLPSGLDDYNTHQRARGGSAVTGIIINATTLNSGGRFFFTASELGDWYLGAFRVDELSRLLDRKRLLQQLTDKELDLEVARLEAHPAQPREFRAAALARWWRHFRRDKQVAWPPEGWERLGGVQFPGELGRVAPGLLRSGKVAAWYLVEGGSIGGGRTPDELWELVAQQMSEIDPELWKAIEQKGLNAPGSRQLVAEFLLELYYLRTAEAMSPKFLDDWRGLRVGHAIGASACFPPAFAPYLINGIYDDLRVARLGLTDGGVYDNTGVTALLDEGCAAIIASDTGSPFEPLRRSPTGRIGLSLLVPGILMHVIGGWQRAALRERRRVTRAIAGTLPSPAQWSPAQQELDAFLSGRRLDALAYFHIRSPFIVPPGHQPVDSKLPQDALVHLRTDLDGFGDVEIAALVNHGYDMADRYVRRYMKTLGEEATWDKAPPRLPKVLPESGQRIKRILLAGGSRWFRALTLKAPVSWLFTIALLVALPLLAIRSHLSLAGVLLRVTEAAVALVTRFVDAIVGGAVWLLSWVLPDLDRGLSTTAASNRPGFLALLVGVLGLVFLIKKARPRREALHTGTKGRRLRKLVVGTKWIRTLSGNLLWIVWQLPLLIVGSLSGLALISYVFYYLPFVRATRVGKPPRPATGSEAVRDDSGIRAG